MTAYQRRLFTMNPGQQNINIGLKPLTAGIRLRLIIVVDVCLMSFIISFMMNVAITQACSTYEKLIE